jgi:E3 SUMO-protein ligase NSE2
MLYPEDGDDSDDDDVQVGGVTQDYRCPLTLTLLVDPLTSYARFLYSLLFSMLTSLFRTTCGHSFAADAIKEYLKNNRTAREKCPTAGCNKIISLADLKPNKELAKKAKEAARRERMREEEDGSDDSDIVE